MEQRSWMEPWRCGRQGELREVPYLVRRLLNRGSGWRSCPKCGQPEAEGYSSQCLVSLFLAFPLSRGALP